MRLTEWYDNGKQKGILVKEFPAEDAMKTLFVKYGEQTDYSDCDEGYLGMEKLKEYEDAEEQGLLLRLPCAIGSTIYKFEYPTRVDENGDEWSIIDKKKATVKPLKFALCHLNRIGDLYFLTKEEAEQALAEMQGK